MSSNIGPDALIGIDIGGTNIRARLIRDGIPAEVASSKTNAEGSVDEVLNQVFAVVDQLMPRKVRGIGIGVPSVVDTKAGIVYDVQNIPSWKQVAIKAIFEKRYKVPVFVNNDANCFALGEKYFGKGANCDNLIGLILGTGFAGGVIINGSLYEGVNGGAGEFGMISYLDGIHEDYCSGQFFVNRDGRSGEVLHRKAASGDKHARRLFEEFGEHVGSALKNILFAYDPEMIVFGGSIRKAFPMFEEPMWAVLRTFAYRNSLKNLRIEVSDDDAISMLGAAALVLNANRNVRTDLY